MLFAFAGRVDLLHRVIVPFAFGFEDGLGVIHEGLNQIVRKVDVSSGLANSIYG